MDKCLLEHLREKAGKVHPICDFTGSNVLFSGLHDSENTSVIHRDIKSSKHPCISHPLLSTDPLHTLPSLRSGSQDIKRVSSGFTAPQVREFHCMRTLTKQLRSRLKKNIRLFTLSSPCLCYPPDTHITSSQHSVFS